ncbi:thiamine-phosphate kinase [Nitrincola sp. A-D6]|uniref:thiamine-phosphate kinase n=1 Tax=Nitrincola sp. A-D6 TaxID=1545442 RepID=UPI000AD7B1B7|nr:thiamine-phosphate kinase [Nitrincola sp. A-D6]
MAQRSAELGIILVGGDTTRGPLALTLTVQGSVKPGLALQRNNAQVDDIIAVTGTLGDSRAGLESLLHPQKAAMADVDWLRQRFYRPEPRLQLAQQLAPLAHSAIDISDGLLADLGHLLQASQLGAELELTTLPLSAALRNFSQDQLRLRDWALTGGEDFELCLTIPAANWEQAQALATNLAVPLTAIGRIIAAPTLCLLEEGQPVPLSQVRQGGYDHFRRTHD